VYIHSRATLRKVCISVRFVGSLSPFEPSKPSRRDLVLVDEALSSLVAFVFDFSELFSRLTVSLVVVVLAVDFAALEFVFVLIA